MTKIHDMIVNTFLHVVKGVGHLEMQNVLSSIKEHNTPEVYKNTLQGLHSNFLLLKDAAAKTKSHFDDGIVDLVLDAVTASATSDGIVLS